MARPITLTPDAPCTTCRQVWPACGFQYAMSRGHRQRRGKCRDCLNTERAAARRAAGCKERKFTPPGVCSVCFMKDPPEGFMSRRTKICKPCGRQYSAVYRKKHPARVKCSRKAWDRKNPHYKRMWALGVTHEQVERLRAQQKNRCAICAERMVGARNEHLDHDHASGQVRGLLCRLCNAGLGFFRDSSSLLHNASTYLAAHKSEKSLG